jgi:RNA polymerase sigma-70 factor (ECF subfamily)
VPIEDTALIDVPLAWSRKTADALLVEQIRRGSVEAGRRFVDDHYRDVYRYLLYLTGSPETAADLTQETFVQAWRGLDALEERIYLRPWLHRIAHREFLQAVRGQRPFASLDELPDLPEPRAGELAEAVELRELLRQLPLEEREVIVLHYLEGYRCEEIAEILGAPLGRVKHRLVEARARLRQALGDDGPGQGR